MQFSKALMQGTLTEKIQLVEMRIQFAELCLSVPKKLTSECVYNAFSHLACIEELGINIWAYDRLQEPSEKERLNTDAYVKAKNKIVEAKDLLRELVEVCYEAC